MASEEEVVDEIVDVVVVGAGPAGIGCACLLQSCKFQTVVLDRGEIGESFKRWPAETRFISPSFTSNFFGSVDLNAITPDSSPAYGQKTEHPNGQQYAAYLTDVAKVLKIDVRCGTEVLGFEGAEEIPEGESRKQADAVPSADDKMEPATITVRTAAGSPDYLCKFVVWAGGEYQFPKTSDFLADAVRPSGTYKNLLSPSNAKKLKSDGGETDTVIVGGGESGIDAAYHLWKNGSNVTVIDPDALWDKSVSDSSYGLSPCTLDRLREMCPGDANQSPKLTLLAERVTAVTKETVTTDKRVIKLQRPAVDATGFDLRKSLASELFNFDDDGVPILNQHDGSTRLKNVFLSGPSVKHGSAIFCFIYKYRQRWAVVARRMLKILGVEELPDEPRWGPIHWYSQKGFLLDDLSCCGDSCAC